MLSYLASSHVFETWLWWHLKLSTTTRGNRIILEFDMVLQKVAEGILYLDIYVYIIIMYHFGQDHVNILSYLPQLAYN